MTKFDGSPVYIVSDSVGRGHLKPFGRFDGNQQGTMIEIGGKSYAVTSDGRVSIPQSLMEQYGTKDPTTGRNVVIARCSSKNGKFAAQLLKPKTVEPGTKTHKIARLREVKPGRENVLSPKDAGDWTFSE